MCTYGRTYGLTKMGVHSAYRWVGGVVLMDDQISDANAREENRAWSPSDGRAFARKCIAEARAGIEAGRKRFAERRRAIEERRARRDQETR